MHNSIISALRLDKGTSSVKNSSALIYNIENTDCTTPVESKHRSAFHEASLLPSRDVFGHTAKTNDANFVICDNLFPCSDLYSSAHNNYFGCKCHLMTSRFDTPLMMMIMMVMLVIVSLTFLGMVCMQVPVVL